MLSPLKINLHSSKIYLTLSLKCNYKKLETMLATDPKNEIVSAATTHFVAVLVAFLASVQVHNIQVIKSAHSDAL